MIKCDVYADESMLPHCKTQRTDIFRRNFLAHDSQLSLMDGSDLSVHHFVSLFHTPLHIPRLHKLLSHQNYCCTYIKIVATSNLHLHITTIVRPLATFALWSDPWVFLQQTMFDITMFPIPKEALAIQEQAKSLGTRSSLAWKCCLCCIFKWGKLAMPGE